METMKKTLGVVGLAAMLATTAFAGITTTKHNLSNSGTNATFKASAGENNDEICIFCHTPHAGNTAFVGAPLWNKKTLSATGFTMYGAAAAGTAGITIAGTSVGADANGTVGNASLACLSCHDGVSAVNSIVNTAGSGLNADTTNYLTSFMGSSSAKVVTATATNIGTDLRNDHPITLAYTAGKAGLRATSSNLNTVTTVTWTGATLVSDLLRNNKVECSSCHDPHEAVNVSFLRATNAGSKLCIGCHDK